MASYTKFLPFPLYLGGAVNLTSDVFKFVLTLTAPVNTNAVYADLTEIANGNGYTTGGETVPNTAYTGTGGTSTFVGDSVTWTAVGSAMANFAYVVLMDNTVASPVVKPLVAFWAYGSTVTLNVGETFQAKPNNSSTGGTIFTLA